MRRRAYVCHYCRRALTAAAKGGSTAATRDHVVPKALGGTTTVLCCRACNEIKGDMNPDQWREIMALVPQWWGLYGSRGPRGVRLYIVTTQELPTDR